MVVIIRLDRIIQFFLDCPIKLGIEEMLETMYPKLTKTEKEKKGKLEALIVKAKGKIFNDIEAEKAHIIRLLRNDAVHELKRPSKEDTYEAILNTALLIEKILREKSRDT